MNKPSVPESKTYLHSTGTAVPDRRLHQDEIQAFMASTMKADLPPGTRDEKVSFLDTIYSKIGIETRHTVIDDFKSPDPESNEFFPRNRRLEPLPGTHARMEKYQRHAPDLAANACRQALDRAGIPADAVTHLIFTSCTGHVAPGPDVALIDQLNLPPSVRRVQIGFMGCFAGLNTIRTAADIARGQPDAVVLMVCLELCTLHFQKDFSKNGIVSDGLFSDGCAASVVTGSKSVERGTRPLAEIGSAESFVDSDHASKMTWQIGNQGFRMYLSPEIPDQLAPHLQPFLTSLIENVKGSPKDIRQWAIHPGGRRILDLVQTRFELNDDCLAPSRSVFSSFGNMSSPTILFILDHLLRNDPTPDPAVVLGFGPGLTMEGLTLHFDNQHVPV